MWVITLDDQIVYAATDPIRFSKELADNYAGAQNAKWDFIKPAA